MLRSVSDQSSRADAWHMVDGSWHPTNLSLLVKRRRRSFACFFELAWAVRRQVTPVPIPRVLC